MGVDAIWICHTCKEYFVPRLRAIFQSVFLYKVEKGKIKPKTLENFADRLQEIFVPYKEAYYVDDMAWSLRVLAAWLRKHRGHEIWLTTDAQVELYDFDDYNKLYFTGLKNGKILTETEEEIRKRLLKFSEKKREEVGDDNV